MTDPAAAERMLDKLRAFVRELDDDERRLFAALVAPGVAAAHGGEDEEVAGFGQVAWRPADLPEGLARAVRERQLRIVEADD